MMEDDDELEMFVEAQDTVWDDVLSELRAGKKQTHWMWFVFPQLASLGQSDMAKLYGLNDLAEATEYYHHPVLGPRLALCWMYCPDNVVSKSLEPTIDLEYCKGCGICAEECPVKAIEMVSEEEFIEGGNDE